MTRNPVRPNFNESPTFSTGILDAQRQLQERQRIQELFRLHTVLLTNLNLQQRKK